MCQCMCFWYLPSHTMWILCDATFVSIMLKYFQFSTWLLLLLLLFLYGCSGHFPSPLLHTLISSSLPFDFWLLVALERLPSLKSIDHSSFALTFVLSLRLSFYLYRIYVHLTKRELFFDSSLYRLPWTVYYTCLDVCLIDIHAKRLRWQCKQPITVVSVCQW